MCFPCVEKQPDQDTSEQKSIYRIVVHKPKELQEKELDQPVKELDQEKEPDLPGKTLDLPGKELDLPEKELDLPGKTLDLTEKELVQEKELVLKERVIKEMIFEEEYCINPNAYSISPPFHKRSNSLRITIDP